MAERTVFLADCPARSALELISGTWSVVVLCGLGHGPRRYSELLDRAGGISRKMLTQTLRRTAQAGLVTPPSRRGGAYRLTPLGESLMGPLTTLTSWAEEHGDELAEVSGQTGLGTLGFLRDLYRRVLTPRTGRG